MILMFEAINEIINVVEQSGVIDGRKKILSKRIISTRKAFMRQEYVVKGGNENMSPLTATTKIKTEYLLNHLSKHESKNYKIGELLRNRNETIIYKIDATFRGDPYPGALAAIDYLLCREGKTFEERKYNLVICCGNLTIDDKNKIFEINSDKSTIHDFINAVKASEGKKINQYSEGIEKLLGNNNYQIFYGIGMPLSEKHRLKLNLNKNKVDLIILVDKNNISSVFYQSNNII